MAHLHDQLPTLIHHISLSEFSVSFHNLLRSYISPLCIMYSLSWVPRIVAPRANGLPSKIRFPDTWYLVHTCEKISDACKASLKVWWSYYKLFVQKQHRYGHTNLQIHALYFCYDTIYSTIIYIQEYCITLYISVPYLHIYRYSWQMYASCALKCAQIGTIHFCL